MIDGLVVVDKPTDWTSHDVVARRRRLFGQKRIGHSGTLDPGATGVLLVGLGRATRILRWLTELPKTYTGEVVFGVATSTLDDSGEETGRWEMAVSPQAVADAAGTLTGPILQVPPMVSAVQVGGKRLHQLAREGITVEREPRAVTVHSFTTAATADPHVFAVNVTCSSGTYIRVLAADLGIALGGGAHLRNLRRTAIGSFDVGQARTLEEIEPDPAAALLTPAEAMRDYEGLAVDADIADQVAHGRPLASSVLGATGGGPWAVHDRSGTLLAVYEARPESTILRPAVVLSG